MDASLFTSDTSTQCAFNIVPNNAETETKKSIEEIPQNNTGIHFHSVRSTSLCISRTLLLQYGSPYGGPTYLRGYMSQYAPCIGAAINKIVKSIESCMIHGLELPIQVQDLIKAYQTSTCF